MEHLAGYSLVGEIHNTKLRVPAILKNEESPSSHCQQYTYLTPALTLHSGP
jgi:hypothetical protein